MFINNLELRTPPVALPLVGQGFSFVVFHDAGNAFDTVSHMWSSLGHWTQRDQQACKTLTGSCDFNYIAQAVGGGLRYHTPIGPVRLDVGYALNPAYFAVQSPPGQAHVDQLRHLNISFSIGQTF